jgi:hypothetical protein
LSERRFEFDLIALVVGDIVTGRIAIPYRVPQLVDSVTISMVTRDGLRLVKVRFRSQIR